MREKKKSERENSLSLSFARSFVRFVRSFDSVERERERERENSEMPLTASPRKTDERKGSEPRGLARATTTAAKNRRFRRRR